MASDGTKGTVKSGRHILSIAAAPGALLLLSLLWACGALRADSLPQLAARLPLLQTQALVCTLLAAVSALLAVLRRAEWPRERQLWTPVLIGIGLFVAPSELLQFASGSMNGFTRAALLTLVPVCAIVFEPYIGANSTNTTSRNGLLAALISVAGALCVFPFRFPYSIESTLGFCAIVLAAACIAAANCFAVAALAQPSQYRLAPTAAIAGSTAALVFAPASLWLEQPIWRWHELTPALFWTTTIEVPALLLLFWLMRRLSASRMATRYVLAPLFTFLIGSLAVRVQPQPRTWLGLALMAAGAGYILLVPAKEEDTKALSLRS